MLYTLEDVKNMIADFEDVKPEDVEVYDCCSLVLQDSMSDNNIVTEQGYIFQVDK